MRLDAVSPRTGMLAAFAVLSLLAWGATGWGLGGGLPASPEGREPLALPEDGAIALRGLEPKEHYTQLTARPLFNAKRQPAPFFVEGATQEEAATGFEYVLSSVLIAPTLRMAVLQPVQGGEAIRVKQGEAPEAAPQWRLVELLPRSAAFEGPQGRQTLELRVFDGSGGVSVPSPFVSQTALPVSTPMQSAPVADPVSPPRTPANPPKDRNQQVEEIRQRIEARRRELLDAQRSTPGTAQ